MQELSIALGRLSASPTTGMRLSHCGGAVENTKLGGAVNKQQKTVAASIDAAARGKMAASRYTSRISDLSKQRRREAAAQYQGDIAA